MLVRFVFATVTETNAYQNDVFFCSQIAMSTVADSVEQRARVEMTGSANLTLSSVIRVKRHARDIKLRIEHKKLQHQC